MDFSSIAIITAQNPRGIRHSSSKNYDLNRQLWLDLKARKYDLTEIDGEYADTKEKSFVVLDVPRPVILELQAKYRQKAVVWGFLRSEGFKHPVIHWQYIKNGRSIANKITAIAGHVFENRNDFLYAVKLRMVPLPHFNVEKLDSVSTDHEEINFTEKAVHTGMKTFHQWLEANAKLGDISDHPLVNQPTPPVVSQRRPAKLVNPQDHPLYLKPDGTDETGKIVDPKLYQQYYANQRKINQTS